MATPYRCCANCGAPLRPDVRFCEACGRPVAAEASGPPARFCGRCGAALKAGQRFCEACGAPLSAPAAEPPPPPLNAAQRPAGRTPAPARAAAPPAKKRGSILAKGVVILVGLLIIGFGLQGPLLGAFGATATALVTDVSPGEETGEYTIEYRFTVPGGRQVTGSTERQAYNIATLPREGSTIAVRYLRALPTINGPVSGGLSVPASLGTVVLGIVVVVLGAKLSWTFSRGGDD